jgi:tRNA A-37 threonylcarbamoyl transferase component Bud32/HAMP domain-containing protein
LGLTKKILLLTGALVVALVAATLAFTTARAERLARRTIREDLRQTSDVWEASQAERYNKLKLGVRVLANDPYFKAALAERDRATTLDSLGERGRDLGADFMLATDSAGVLVSRTDRPTESGADLSAEPIVRMALEGEDAATVWRQGDRLYTAVAVPMQTGPDLVGVLVAGYGISESVASGLRRLTRSEIAYLVDDPGGEPRLSVSSLGPQEPALEQAIARGAVPRTGDQVFEVDLGGERNVGVRIPLRGVTGQELGAVLALRSLASETAAFRDFRRSLVLISLLVMTVGLVVAYVTASRITGPVRKLAAIVERARDGSFTGAVTVPSRDEIGVLARAFNGLLEGLREKEEIISYLRESVVALSESAGLTPSTRRGAEAGRSLPPDAPTLAIDGPTVAASASRASLARGGIFAGRYEILDVVGKGGMGVVYRAHDRQLDETVAVKLLRSEVLARDPSLRERFKQEIKLARRITHRNVLRTHDFGETDGIPYISMEYHAGVTLKELVRSRGALPLGIGLSVAKQICQGLEAAHETGVVHRDIKPQNILIVPETGQVKIMDFGIARVSAVGEAPTVDQAGITLAGTMLGTPDYMPPEQVQGRPADFRSDIYSLGIVLFEAFTGRLPFGGDSPLAVVMAQVHAQPPRPRSLNPRLPEELEGVILRCLEKDPQRRWPTTQAILAALGSISVRPEAA